MTLTRAEADSANIGIELVEINSQTGTSYTLTASDNSKVIECDNASPITVTVPLESSEDLGAGFNVIIFQKGAGTVTIAPEGAVVLNSFEGDLDLGGQYGSAVIYKTGTDEFNVVMGASNSTTLDGLDSTQFLRSDEDDTATGLISLDGGIGASGSKVAETQTNGLYFGLSVSGANRGSLSNDTANTIVRNHVNAGLIALQAAQTDSTNVNCVLGDPDDSVDLYHNGSVRFRTGADGTAELVGSATGVTNESFFEFLQTDNTRDGFIGVTSSGSTNVAVGSDAGSVTLANAGSTVVETTTNGLNFGTGVSGSNRGSLTHNASNAIVRNHVNSGLVALQAARADSTNVNCVLGDPDGSVDLQYNGVVTVSTHSTGIRIGTAPSSTAELEITSDGGDATIKNLNHGGQLELRGEETGGAVRTLVLCDPDAGVTLAYQGNGRLVTGSQGIFVGTAPSTTAELNLVADGGDATIINRNHGFDVVLEAEDSGGVAAALFRGDPDGSVTLYEDAAIRFITQSGGNCAIRGDDTGDSNTSILRFEQSDGTRDGYVGVGTGSNRDVHVYADADSVILYDGGAVKFATTSQGVQLNSGPEWISGTGTPEGAVTASVGSLFSRTDGGASTTLYVKESGSGNTGWVAK